VAFLGFSVVNDAYSLANTLPNIIFELLLGGVLTSVAIPLLSRARSDPDGGAAYTQRLTTMDGGRPAGRNRRRGGRARRC
jgi:putative peptidoglycan lipid II flippase